MQPLKTNTDHDIEFKRTTAGHCGDVLIIIILAVITFLVEEARLIPLREQNIPDPSIYDQPDTTETVSNLNLVLASFLPWYILFLLDLILFRVYDTSFSFNQWLKQFYIMNKMAWFSGMITVIVTDIIKCSIGNPRPFFQTALDEFNDGLIDESDLDEARLSFVSGHASISMNSLFLFTLMLHSAYKYAQSVYYNQLSSVHMLRCDNPHNYYFSWLWYVIREIPILSMILVFTPTMAAMYIGLTRIVDYKHFPVDVVSGMLIGGCCALIAYSLFWNETYFVVSAALKKKYDALDEYENKVNDSIEAQRLNIEA
eukprot:212449_1